MAIDRLRDRYDNDSTFRAVVTMLEAAVHNAQLTPSEVRDAAMLACMRIEERRGTIFVVDANGVRTATEEEYSQYSRNPYR